MIDSATVSITTSLPPTARQKGQEGQNVVARVKRQRQQVHIGGNVRPREPQDPRDGHWHDKNIDGNQIDRKQPERLLEFLLGDILDEGGGTALAAGKCRRS
jgi:hypothetical protein